MRNCTIHVSDVSLDLSDMTFIEIHSIHEAKLSIILKYH